MTIEESNRIRNSWKAILLTSNKLTPFQIMDLENIKEEDKLNIELLDFQDLNSQLRQLFNDGKLDTLIGRLSRLPVVRKDSSLGLKVKMPTGKTISYNKYLELAAHRMTNGQEPLEVTIIAPKGNSSKKYVDMDLQEFQQTLYGRGLYEQGRLHSVSKHGFRYAWEEIISTIDIEDYFNPIKLVDWLNSNPCFLGSLFKSEVVFFAFIQWLADNDHIDREVINKVDIYLEEACSNMHQSNEAIEVK